MDLKNFVNVLRFSKQIRLLEIFMLGFFLQFIDVVIIIYLALKGSPYLVIGFIFFVAFLGYFFSRIAYAFSKKETYAAFHQAGEVPYRQFDKVLGTSFCAFLMIMPGFITFFIGLLCLQENLRRLLGTALRKFLGINLEELYNYMRLYEIEV